MPVELGCPWVGPALAWLPQPVLSLASDWKGPLAGSGQGPPSPSSCLSQWPTRCPLREHKATRHCLLPPAAAPLHQTAGGRGGAAPLPAHAVAPCPPVQTSAPCQRQAFGLAEPVGCGSPDLTLQPAPPSASPARPSAQLRSGPLFPQPSDMLNGRVAQPFPSWPLPTDS